MHVFSFNMYFVIGLLVCLSSIVYSTLLVNKSVKRNQDDELKNKYRRDNFKLKQVVGQTEDYNLIISSSSPAVLDSVVHFHAQLLIQGKEVINKTLFRYQWYNNANNVLLSTEAEYESEITEHGFYSYSPWNVKPGTYIMEVIVFKHGDLVASNTLEFNLTEHLNGKLNMSQELTYKKDKFIFATRKPINLSAIISDKFEEKLTSVYIWYVNRTFHGWNQTETYIYPGGKTPGDLNITVRIKSLHFISKQNLTLHKLGVFTKTVQLKDEINIINITGVGEVQEGQPLVVNISYNGSNPTQICWHLSKENTSIINCSRVLEENQNKYSIRLPADNIKTLGTYQLNITVQNDVSRVRTCASITVVDNKGHKMTTFVAIPVTFCIIGFIVTVAALSYAYRVRQKSHPTEVADFNFHPHIRNSPSNLSLTVKNLLNQFMERGEFDGRRSFVRSISNKKLYGSFDDSDSNEEEKLLKNVT